MPKRRGNHRCGLYHQPGQRIFWYVFLLTIPMSYYTFVVVYQDYVMNVYFWLLLGILFRLPDLAQKTFHAQTAAKLTSEPGQV